MPAESGYICAGSLSGMVWSSLGSPYGMLPSLGSPYCRVQCNWWLHGMARTVQIHWRKIICFVGCQAVRKHLTHWPLRDAMMAGKPDTISVACAAFRKSWPSLRAVFKVNLGHRLAKSLLLSMQENRAITSCNMVNTPWFTGFYTFQVVSRIATASTTINRVKRRLNNSPGSWEATDQQTLKLTY